MTDIYSNIDQARAIAKRLIRHNEDVRRAEVKRDICLYKYLESIYELDERLRNMPLAEARKTLKAKYGSNVPSTRKTGMFAIELTLASLAPKTARNTQLCRDSSVKRKDQVNRLENLCELRYQRLHRKRETVALR
jgi:hypothetical protein